MKKDRNLTILMDAIHGKSSSYGRFVQHVSNVGSFFSSCLDGSVMCTDMACGTAYTIGT